MKKTRKKLLGLLGLFLVAAITTFAALLPPERTSAVTSQSVTDEITIRVVGSKPLVSFTAPESGTRFNTPEQTFSFDYENVTDMRVELEYTKLDGTKHTYTVDEYTADYEPGSRSFSLNFDTDNRFGYGSYVMRVTGNGYGAENVAEDVIEFTYHSFDPSLPGGPNGPGSSEDNPLTGNPVIDFGVAPDDPHIYRLEVNVYDEDGNLIEEFSPQDVYSPFEDLELKFQEHGMPSGWYKVEIQAYDENNEPFGDPVELWFYYLAPEMPVPNTGAPFADLNISRQDYLISGLVIFGLAAIGGAAMVVRRKASSKKRK